jgi:hypothetical protein
MQQAIDGWEEEGLLDYDMDPLECVDIWSLPAHVGPFYYSTTSPVRVFSDPRLIEGDVSSTVLVLGITPSLRYSAHLFPSTDGFEVAWVANIEGSSLAGDPLQA